MAKLYEALPAARDFGWILRKAEDADVTRTELGDGRREIRIDHAALSGVTTEMLAWWFQVFDGLASYRGDTLPAYHLWHPRDHIRVALPHDRSGRVAPGGPLRIQEVFGRDPRFEADIHAVIHRWDGRGIGFHFDVLGHRVVELDHVFSDTPQGVCYRTCMRIGAGNGPLRRFLNGQVVRRRFPEATASAWIRHNVEEVGFFTDFLPELFATRGVRP